MLEIYEATTFECSKLITARYSTSFSLGIRILDQPFRNPVYAIYGFVRYADEIVDTFHTFEKEGLLMKFREDTYRAIDEKISLNPVLHSFQKVVNKYGIPTDMIEAFFISMGMDLVFSKYEEKDYQKYIFGSAEVVGLMCLKVFCENDDGLYSKLSPWAQKLGSAFQKVNFLRDMQDDIQNRGRVYFPNLKTNHLTEDIKLAIVQEIEEDFKEALKGIRSLPAGSKAGVYLAYVYYLTLLKKIRNKTVTELTSHRIRIPNVVKFTILLRAYLKFRLNLI